MEEVWKDIDSVPEMMASSFGRVKLKPYEYILRNGRVMTTCPKPRIGREMTHSTGRDGVPKRRQIYIGRLRKAFTVARLVCEAFHGSSPFGKTVVMHLDEDPSNNIPANLKWGTQRENLNMPKAIAAFKARTGKMSCRAIGKRKKDGMASD